jgi:hypothetical protein
MITFSSIVWALAFSPDGSLPASGALDVPILLADLASLHLLGPPPVHRELSTAWSSAQLGEPWFPPTRAGM